MTQPYPNRACLSYSVRTSAFGTPYHLRLCFLQGLVPLDLLAVCGRPKMRISYFKGIPQIFDITLPLLMLADTASVAAFPIHLVLK